MLSTGIIATVFFWVGLWGAITVVTDWLFEQFGPYNNPGTQFLIYMFITIASVIVLLRFIGTAITITINNTNNTNNTNTNNTNNKDKDNDEDNNTNNKDKDNNKDNNKDYNDEDDDDDDEED